MLDILATCANPMDLPVPACSSFRHLSSLASNLKLNKPRRRSSARLEQRLHKPLVPGSNPAAATCFHHFFTPLHPSSWIIIPSLLWGFMRVPCRASSLALTSASLVTLSQESSPLGNVSCRAHVGRDVMFRWLSCLRRQASRRAKEVFQFLRKVRSGGFCRNASPSTSGRCASPAALRGQG